MGSYDRNNLRFAAPGLASAARTATTDSDQIWNPSNPGAYFLLRVTAASGTGGLQPRIMVADTDGNLTALNDAPAAVQATGTFLYLFREGALGVKANLQQLCCAPLPEYFRVRVEHVDASSYTYSVDVILLV